MKAKSRFGNIMVFSKRLRAAIVPAREGKSEWMIVAVRLFPKLEQSGAGLG
jgi:hypothetical protein